MSMGSEMREEMMTNDMVNLQYISRMMIEGFWITKGGIELHISGMETSHLFNTIIWLKRNEDYPYSDDYIRKMEKELNARRGQEGI